MSRSSPLLVAEDLSLRLSDDRLLFHGLTQAFHLGRTALVGPNGSGKSTLLDLLAGTRDPTGGCVRRFGVVRRLTQQAADEATTLADLLGLGVPLAALHRLELGVGEAEDLERVGDRWDLVERASAALRELGVAHLVEGAVREPPARDGIPLHGAPLQGVPGADSPWFQPTSRLSGGEASRVVLAGLLVPRPDILLLDEPTNHLDANARRALHDFVAEWEGGIVVATHDRELLRRVDRILELGPPIPRLVTGDLDAWWEIRATEEAAAARAFDHARKELAEVRRATRRTAERQARRNARGARAAASSNEPKVLIGTRKGWSETSTGKLRDRGRRRKDEALERLRSARDHVEDREQIRFAPAPTGLRRDREILRLEGVVLGYPGGPPLGPPLDRTWRGPVRLALTGPNGSGKSTLLRVLEGTLAPLAGRVVRGVAPEDVRMLRQDGIAARRDPGHRHTGHRGSVLDAFRQSHPDLEPAAARGVLANFLFRGDAVLRNVSELSGGERLRLALAATLGGARSPRLLLLDEPTNYLDLAGIEAVESILNGFDGGLVVASHDADFLRVIQMGEVLKLGSQCLHRTA